MTIRVNPQEVYLLERYTSKDYFGELRDTWENMIKHVESCVDAFMQNLSPTCRSRPLSEQPDIAWGNRVLPNFGITLRNLNTGFILLAHNDVKGLGYAHGPLNDHKGQMDYSSDWMTKSDEKKYRDYLSKAVAMAGNICATEGAYWKPLALSNYSELYRGPLDPPAQWPIYRVNTETRVRTGEKTKKSGIYVPDIENSCPEFLSTEYEQAPPARVHIGFEDLLHPSTRVKYAEQPLFEKRSCTWYLVERCADASASVQALQRPTNVQFGRVPAGEECPEEGFYFTPAQPDSRRFFHRGEVMPGYDSAYGATIWQWDSSQQ